jgi:hypothetical protein
MAVLIAGRIKTKQTTAFRRLKISVVTPLRNYPFSTPRFSRHSNFGIVKSEPIFRGVKNG